MKKIKGFTLLELIVVMAIMSILMLGIMQMMKPIRATYIDSVYYESQRNTQNGIITYLSENLRYANNVGIYSGGSVGNAINDFKNNVVNNHYTDSEIHVITIDNSTAYTYNGTTGFHGRLVVNKPGGPGSGYSIADADNPSTKSARVALSEAYYGAFSYSISLKPVTVGAGTNARLKSIDMTIASLLDHSSLGSSKDKNTSTNTQDIATSSKVVSTDGFVICNNMNFSREDSGKYKAPATVVTTTQGVKTYIVFTYPKL